MPRGRAVARWTYLLLFVAGLALLAGGWREYGAGATALPDRYVEGVLGAPSHPNPLFARANPVDADLAALVFSGLMRIGGDGTPVPDLAERWEVTPDGRTYTFYLRPNLYWHDGQPLEADDVAFTVGIVQAPGFQGAPALAVRWSGVTVEVRDPRTVVFRLPAPSASFLTHAALGIVPRHLLADLDAAALAEAPPGRATIGSGPYRLVDLDQTGAALEANPSYHLGLPALDRIELRFYRDNAALLAALAAREVDGALLEDARTPAEDGALAGRPDLAGTPYTLGGYTVLYMNNQRAPLEDPGVRRALSAAVDRPALIRGALGGRGLPGASPLIPGTWAHDPAAPPPPAAAEALFGNAGWLRDARAGGLRRNAERFLRFELVTNNDPTREALAASIAAQLREQGVEVAVTTLSAGALVAERLQRRDYDLALFAWETGPDPDPYAAWHTSQVAPPGLNIAGFRDVLADGLLEAAQRTLDVGERRDLYARFAARFVQQSPSAVLLYPQRLYVRPRTLAGAEAGVLFQPSQRFRDVHRWRIVRAD